MPDKQRGSSDQFITPYDCLRDLLIERAQDAGLSDSEIARAHLRAHPESALNPGTVNRFRNGYIKPGGVKGQSDRAPTPLIEQAFAAALQTTREALWREAIRRWDHS